MKLIDAIINVDRSESSSVNEEQLSIHLNIYTNNYPSDCNERLRKYPILKII